MIKVVLSMKSIVRGGNPVTSKEIANFFNPYLFSSPIEGSTQHFHMTLFEVVGRSPHPTSTSFLRSYGSEARVERGTLC